MSIKTENEMPLATAAPVGMETLDSGEQEMEHLIATHESCLLRYAIGIVGDSHTAQDVVQNVFIKLFKQWQPGMRPTDSIRPWLYRVTHNEAIDHLRREKRRMFLHARQAESCADVDSGWPTIF